MSVNCAQRNLSMLVSSWPRTENHVTISFAHNHISHLRKISTISGKTVSISFKNCTIESIESDLFINVINIVHVDLSWNLLKYETIRGDIFRGCFNNGQYEPIKLQEINLSYNNIKNLEPRTFQFTPNLTRLDLRGNPLHMISENMWSAISHLHYLQSLNFANTSLSKFSMKSYNETKNLKKLDISHNKLKNIPRNLSILFPSLEMLIINDNPIEELTEQSFWGNVKFFKLFTCRKIKSNNFRTGRIKRSSYK